MKNKVEKIVEESEVIPLEDNTEGKDLEESVEADGDNEGD